MLLDGTYPGKGYAMCSLNGPSFPSNEGIDCLITVNGVNWFVAIKRQHQLLNCNDDKQDLIGTTRGKP
jgi:hypothetical protein